MERMEFTRTTLKEFWESDYPDGHYAVWTAGKKFNGESFLYGFSGEVVEYTVLEGFKNYPDWMDEKDDREIGIVLLSQLPNIEQLSSGEF